MPFHYFSINFHIVVELSIQSKEYVIVFRVENNAHKIRNRFAFHTINALYFLPVEQIFYILSLLYFRWTSFTFCIVFSSVHEALAEPFHYFHVYLIKVLLVPILYFLAY